VAAAAQAAEMPRPWVQLGSDGTLSVRALVVPGAACPPVAVDGKTVATARRGAPDLRFPVQLCEARAPPGAAKLAVGKTALPTLAAQPRRVVVIGDTGCRLEGRWGVQDCNDPVAWPFATLAQRAAARSPDLVIHVGDYYYRESACPVGRAGCAGSPHGDNWPVWRAELFDPAAPLLAAAPWVMVRGNHELCRRGGEGWTRLLDPHSGPLVCADHAASYRLALGGLDLLLFDSADGDDFKTPDPAMVAAYSAEFDRLLKDGPPHAWLLTHRPVWALAGGALFGMNVNLTEQTAIRGHVSPGLDLVLSGHLHDFASYDFGPERPAQLVVGTGGDSLLDLAETPLTGTEIDGVPIRNGFAMKNFGYFVFDRADDGWDGAFYGPDDTVHARCALRGRVLQCH
jgi:hypothetical protein